MKSVEVTQKHRIFLLFDELNIFKEDLYYSILRHLGADVHVDIFFHHFNPVMFKKLVQESNGKYTHYIIMPTNFPQAPTIIKTLPVGDVFILDQTKFRFSKLSRGLSARACMTH